MKKSITRSLLMLLACLAVNVVFAQSPNQFKYQAVLRDATGNVIPLTAATVVVDILQGSAAGTLVYEETQSITTTAQGVLNLTIGAGTVNSGVFANINWCANSYWVKVSVNGTAISNGQLLSVPYALNVKGINVIPNGNVGIGTLTPQSKLHVAGFVQLEGNPDAQILFGTTGANGKRGLGSLAGWDPNMLYLNGWGDFTSGVMVGGNFPSNLTVNGTVKITDGTQGANKVLTSDASGNGHWVTNTGITPAVIASLSSTAYNLTNISGQYTGSSITLGPGKWSIQACMLLNNDASSLWVRSSFSSSSSSFISTPDIIGASYFSGYKPANVYGLVNGTIIINNTSGAAKTYYYWTLNIQVYSGSLNLSNFGTSLWMEDQMVAYPMN